MKVLFWIIVIPLLFIAGFFAVANRELVVVDLWPLFTKVSVPLYLALIGTLTVGFLLGAAVAWWGGRAARIRGRQATRRADALARERDALRAEVDTLRPKPPTLEMAPQPASPAPATVPAVWPSP
jgi:uncharacterized integral membrane protein